MNLLHLLLSSDTQSVITLFFMSAKEIHRSRTAHIKVESVGILFH